MNEFTVGDLRSHLDGLDDTVKLSFSGHLTFQRLKRWGDNEFIVEFDEPQAFLSDEFKKNNPNVKVAFIDTSGVELDESGLAGGPIDVEIR
jgi:hypothetical protein